MKVDGSLKSLIQGVSQQPPRARLPGQCTAQENMSSNPVDGLTRRPPSELIATLLPYTGTQPVWSDVDYGDGNKFILAILPDEIRAFDLEGNEITVTEDGNAFDYLASASDYALTTLNNNTYIANKSTVMGFQETIPGTPDVKSFIDYNSIVYLLGGQYGRTYRININWSGKTSTVTMTIASPAVVSWASHGLAIGTPIVFTTTGALPTGLVAGTTYYVASAGYGANSFQVAATKGGASINTSGTQSGVHTATSTVISEEHQTDDGGTAADSEEITTEYIATQLETLLNANITFTANFRVTRASDVLYIQKTSNPITQKFSVTVADGDGGSNIFAINNSASDTSKLPRYAPQGYHVAITGSGEASQDDWYLEFSIPADSTGNPPALGAGFGKDGTWIETVKNDTPYLLDQETMPHVLEFDPDNVEFTFRQGNWEGRQVGDEDSNEDPSFIGNTVNDLGYFQGRLVMLSAAAVIMSRTNKPEDFWIESATTGTDSDAIDVESTAEGVSKMLRIVPHNRDLVIFADKAQFIIFGRNAVTWENTSLVLTTSFESNLTAAPVAGGKNVFFAINYGNFTGIREFYTEGAADINDSRPITQHVLKYIEGQVLRMASSSNFDVLIVQSLRTSQAPLSRATLNIYEYIWLDDRKVQSSWSRWTMPYNVRYFFFDESVIYLVYRIEDNFVLEKLDLDVQDDTDLNYQVKLDRKVYVPTVNTEIVDLYEDMPEEPEDVLFIQGEGCPHPGLVAEVEEYDLGSNTYTLKKDMEGGTVIAGIPYLSSYKPTMPQVKDQDGVKVGTGILTVKNMIVNTRLSGEMKARITSRFREDVDLNFSPRIIGDPSTVIGEAPIADSTFVVPIRDRSDIAEVELYTNSQYPLTMLNIEWIGDYKKRGKRITQGGE